VASDSPGSRGPGQITEPLPSFRIVTEVVCTRQKPLNWPAATIGGAGGLVESGRGTRPDVSVLIELAVNQPPSQGLTAPPRWSNAVAAGAFGPRG
jgi:hypothetical protein